MSGKLDFEEAASGKDVAMKALGLSLLFGFAALAGPAHAGVPAAHPGVPAVSHTVLRPPVVAPRGNSRPGSGWRCNPRRFASAAFYAPSWFDYSGYPQADAAPPDAAPSPVVNYVYVNEPMTAPVAAPPQEFLGPRFIAVDRLAFPLPRRGHPLVIYGNGPQSEN